MFPPFKGDPRGNPHEILHCVQNDRYELGVSLYLLLVTLDNNI